MKHLISVPGAMLLAALASLPVFAGSAADEVHVMDPYVRAVPPMMENSAMFVTLHNMGKTDRALVSASSDAAKVVELHTHTMDGGVMRMRQVEKIDITAGDTTVLEPGGLHVMLLGLTRPLKTGESVQVDLRFDDGSNTLVEAPIKDVAAMHKGGGHAGHH
jgi:copper(I)-binding protein